ncbi:MAG: hypothetical protein CVT68_01770 [Actinobacteria bacterium HGW-Actinobacteria-8]|nr:MAG: hypothetical protein CVT68_01770 [Actinobacteria bacterium HGW-Actinobacteria-8]
MVNGHPTLRGTTLPGTTLPGTTLPGTTLPGTTLPGMTAHRTISMLRQMKCRPRSHPTTLAHPHAALAVVARPRPGAACHQPHHTQQLVRDSRRRVVTRTAPHPAAGACVTNG